MMIHSYVSCIMPWRAMYVSVCGYFRIINLRLHCLQPADIYLIDEPSAYLDSEQRIVAAKVIKRFILHAKKTAFVVEHDFIMATYLADRVIVYEGKPSIDCVANTPQSLLTGMNLFLSVSDEFWMPFSTFLCVCT